MSGEFTSVDGTAGSPRPEVSFVVPARNEELLLGATLRSIHDAARALELPYELIVVNDDSTDHTAELAAELGAQVVHVCLNNIAAVRNAGAREASGRVLFFLDADTLLPANTLRGALDAIEKGAVGGGAAVVIEGMRWYQKLLAATFTFIWQRVCGWAAGCSVFARHDVFREIGGFDEKYFAAEERYISEALKTRGEVTILREPVITSGRKLRLYSTSHLILVAVRALLIKRGRLTSREGLEVLYDAPRESAPGASPRPS